MPHPYDATTKYLVQTRLADWLPFCGRKTTAPVEIIDADLATVTAAADRVLRVLDDPHWLLHLELQASRDPSLAGRLHLYNTLLGHRHSLRVRTLVILLRQTADAPDLTGLLQQGFADEIPYLVFRYQMVRVWELPVETFLNGGLGILPLAPLSAVSEADLPGVIGRMERRVRQEATPQEAGILWTAADVLMGLRYPRRLVSELMQGVREMKESVTYQGILEDGAIAEAQELLLRLGRKKFGAIGDQIETAVRENMDLERLERWIERVSEVLNWQELLSTP